MLEACVALDVYELPFMWQISCHIYVTVEQAYLSLVPCEAEELRVKLRGALNHSCTSRPNITKDEMKALKELRHDKTQVTLTTDKVVEIDVLDKAEYIDKAEKLLEEKGTYKETMTDRTNR